MAGKQGDKAKMVVVFGLSLVLMISIYFRFIHGKAGRVENQTPPAEPASLNVPLINTRNPLTSQKRMPGQTFLENKIRDIFKPLASSLPGLGPFSPALTSDLREAPEQEAPPADPSFQLKGTIVGGKIPLAIIDGRFVRPGDMIGEYKVVKIGKKDVLLASGNKELTLEILKNE